MGKRESRVAPCPSGAQASRKSGAGYDRPQRGLFRSSGNRNAGPELGAGISVSGTSEQAPLRSIVSRPALSGCLRTGRARRDSGFSLAHYIDIKGLCFAPCDPFRPQARASRSLRELFGASSDEKASEDAPPVYIRCRAIPTHLHCPRIPPSNPQVKYGKSPSRQYRLPASPAHNRG